ncbi:MAG: thiamine phosphate synthase [Bryobacterales bacterium]|nr:thiamine phosphate synthase [Bryobacterales bacterium]
MIRYVITDRSNGGFPALLRQVQRNLADKVDYIQIREKDLPDRELFALTEHIVQLAANTNTRILVSNRADIAIAAEAHGVHLPSGAIAASDWRRLTPPGFVIGVSCHHGDDLLIPGADYILYAPIFAPRSKPQSTPPVGLEGLHQACTATALPVIALGGITWENAPACIAAGAAGIAAITLFQQPSGTMEKHG